MEKQKVILMVANSDTAANGFLAFVEQFEDRNDIRFVMVCHPRVKISVVKGKLVKLGNRSCTVIDFDKEQRRRGQDLSDQEYRYVKDKFYVSLIKAFLNTTKIITENRRGLKKARMLLQKENPDLILLYADNKSELEKFFIYYAKKKQIKTVIAPICFGSIAGILQNPTNGFRQKKKDKLPLTAKIVQRMNPKLVRSHGDEIVFFKQPFAQIIDHLMGFRIPDPWVQGSLADIVCTAYPEQYKEIAGELGPENVQGRLFLTESVEDGIIIEGYKDRERIREKLSEKYHLQGKKTVLIAFSERLQQWPKENDLYDKGIIVQSVLQYYDEVLVSLHPKSDPAENRFLETYEGCHIIEEPLRKIIGAADVIIYGDISSVSRWVEWLQLNSVTYESYSMQEKWTQDRVQAFRDKLADSVQAKQESRDAEVAGKTGFTEFVLDLI